MAIAVFTKKNINEQLLRINMIMPKQQDYDYK